MKSKLLLYAVLGVGGYWLYEKLMAKKQAGYNLQYGVNQVRYKGSSLTESNFDIGLNITNNSSEQLDFDKFTGTLNYKGTTVAVISMDGAGKGITIKPYGSTPVSVPVTINHLSTLASATDIVKKILNRQPVTDLVLLGKLAIGPFTVPVEKNLSFNFSNTSAAPQQVSGSNCFTCVGMGVLN